MGRQQAEYALSWAAVLSLFVATEYAIFSSNLFWTVMGFWALCIAVLPAVVYRDMRNILPFELLFLITIPFYLFLVSDAMGWSYKPWFDNLQRSAQVIAIFFIGFVTVVDFHAYTALKMNKPFAVVITIMLTMALSSFFAIGSFISDELLGSTIVESNRELMVDLLYSALGGVVMAFVLTLYMKRMPLERLERYSLGRLGGGE